MICISLDERYDTSFLRSLHDIDFAEIKMDRMRLSDEDIRDIFSQPIRLIATCRSGYLIDSVRMEYFLKAIEAGASYVDIEVESDTRFKKSIIGAACKKGCKVIISYHDYMKTPSEGTLNEIVRLCFAEGAHIVKIACMVNSTSDAARLIGIFRNKEFEDKVIVMGMGDKGKLVRVVTPFIGGLFTYASLEKGKETAEGQIEHIRLRNAMEVLAGV